MIETTAIEAGGLTWETGTAGAWDGEPLVLLHGFPEHWRTWAEVMPALASQGFRVHAPCLPGYGMTTPPTSYDLVDLAASTAAFCREISGGGGAHLVGHDWGGIVASAAAALHPDAIRSVTLACCAHPASFATAMTDPRQIARSWYVAMFQIPGIERVLSRPWLMDRLSPAVTEIADAESMGRALAYYRANLRPWNLGGGSIGRIPVPGLVIHAGGDVAITERLMLDTAAQLDDLRGFEVLDCGHFIHRECPDAFLATVLPFLRAVA